MAYLKRQERLSDIVHAALAILEKEGITAITARRVAQEANIAVGLIHHYFQSISELKAEALVLLNNQDAERIAQLNQDQTLFDQLVNISLPSLDQHGAARRRIWHEAVFLIEQDAQVKQAYKYCAQQWHQAIVSIIEKGVAQQEFISEVPADSAWRLIGLSCGLESIVTLDDVQFNHDNVRQHICHFLWRELNCQSPR